MKIKYKIYPDADGFWHVDWDLTPDQWFASRNIFQTMPKTYVSPPWRKNRDKEKLEALCEKYAAKICKRAQKMKTERELRTAAPMIEYGCDKEENDAA